MRVAVLVMLSLVGVGCSRFGPVPRLSPARIAIHEESLRKLVKKSPLPEFPEDALKAGVTGVVVAGVTVDEKGNVAQVSILGAPSESIGSSVSQALKQWQFRQVTQGPGGPPVGLYGKLTFYFLSRNGKGTVVNPENAGYVGLEGKL